MRAKLFVGNPPRDGQNSGGVDFMKWRRHGAERKPPRLFRKLTQTERKSGGMDFEGRKRHGAERKPPRLFR
ncbi:hypothetical protein T11_4527 [Trichinella zimbabwensis]|uniref:Uncharacterized protein n=1 Tax=Trichinella zimbabwensis TaxID=268475 RepID=A0A0V1GB54_9BILA|nr:hypothetical protein T11_4527 [Trichinella zimbabwensis]